MVGRRKSQNLLVNQLKAKQPSSVVNPTINSTVNRSENAVRKEKVEVTTSRKRKVAILNGDENHNEERRFSKRRLAAFSFHIPQPLPKTAEKRPRKSNLPRNVPEVISSRNKIHFLKTKVPADKNTRTRTTNKKINVRARTEKEKKGKERKKTPMSRTKTRLLSKNMKESKVSTLLKRKRSLKKIGTLLAVTKTSTLKKSRSLKKIATVLSKTTSHNLSKKKRSPKKIVATSNGTVVLKKKRSTKQKLEPKTFVTEYVKDPTFESNESIPHVSTLAHSRLLIRAVNLKNTNLLKTLINDKKSICSFRVPRSLNINRDALSYALETQNMEAIKMLLDSKLAEKLASFPDVILSDERTGHNSTMMFGHAMRNVTVGRGGKEGNNALLKDRNIYQSYQTSVNFITNDMAKEALTFGFPKPLIQKLSETFPDLQSAVYNNFINELVFAIRAGHNQLAGQLVEEALTRGGWGFNLLHKEVLLNTIAPLTTFKSVSVVKKANLNDRITPLHCAAINPNPTYLTALLNSRPDYGVLDAQNWSVIHYASVCTGTGPLQILLARGISTLQITRDGDTPLHLASALGRVENVKLILQHENKNEDVGEEDAPKDISGSLVQRTNKVGQTALHRAAETGQTAIIKILLDVGADPAKFTPARHDKLTPFMFAARNGHVDVLKAFVQHGIKVDAVDHKGRTALAHAVINGQAHVVSYLLRIGANNLKKDTSGNTLVHYAAAYGWYFCLKLLMEAGCPPNDPNDWKMTPVAISFMKGHMGLVEYILEQSGADVNSRINDSTGVTLLLQAISSEPTKEFYSRLNFLIVNQKADCNIVDFEGNNAFHHLIQTELREKLKNRYNSNSETQKIVFQAAKLLWDNKCNPCATNYIHETPISLAVKYGCFSILNKIFDLSCTLPDVPNYKGNTLLHTMANQAQTEEATKICKKWANDPIKLEILKKMASSCNRSGYTPLLWLLHRVTVVVDDQLVKNIINFMDFLIHSLKSNIHEQSRQSVIHLASQVSYVEAAFDVILPMCPSLELLNYSSQTPLTYAIVNSKEMAAKALLNAGANVNVQMPKMNSLLLLHAVSQNQSFHLIPLMIEKGANIHEVNIHTKNSILHYICRKPHLPFAVESVRQLIRKKINIDAVNKDGRTALHLAVNYRGGETDVSYDIEDILIESKARLNIRDVRGRTPLHMAFVKIAKHSDTSFMDPIELVTTLVRAMKQSIPNFVDEIRLADEFGCTPLHYAAIRGATISCSYLLMEMNDNIDIPDKNGNTPFGLAVLNGHEACALQFQQRGANFILNLNTNLTQAPNLIEIWDAPWQWIQAKQMREENERKKFEKENYPILQEVVRKDWQGILHLMLEKLNNSGVGASSAVAAAINTNRMKLARKLVSRAHSSELLVNNDGETLLHILAKNESICDNNREVCEQIVSILVSKGVSYVALDKNESTALIYAAANRNLILCNLLGPSIPVNNQLPLLYADKYGRTPFTALFWNIDETTELSTELTFSAEGLLEQGALANVSCRYPLIVHPHPGVRYFKCETKIDILSDRYTPLMLAVIVGNYTIVKWLLTIKIPDVVDVNYQDDQGRTALMHAVRLNDIKMVRLILNPFSYNHTKDIKPWQTKLSSHNRNHLFINVKDKKGWTVMDHTVAVHDGNFCYATSDAIVRVLYSSGAEINEKSGDGISPLERAIDMKRFHLVECMEQLLSLSKKGQTIASTIEMKRIHLVECLEKRLSLSKNGQTIAPTGHDELFNINVDSSLLCNTLITTFNTDCEVMVDSIMDTDEDDDDINLIKPDDLMNDDINDKFQVLLDPDQQLHFMCCLTKVDISYGTHGLYNFYKMQLLKQERGKELIILFTRWGRVGDEGQFQKTPFPSEEEAVKEFKKIFRSKTGNAWDNLDTFAAIPKKYRLVELATKRVKKPNQVKIDFPKIRKANLQKLTSLTPSLVKLMEHISMVHQDTARDSVKYYGFDHEYEHDLPFGSLTFETLKKGAAVLEQIEELIKKRDELNTRELFSATNEINFMESVLKPSEEFYGLIPVYGFSTEALSPIFTMDQLREKQKVIRKLIHLEFASQLLIAAQHNLNVTNPFEYIFRCLNTKIEALVEGEEEAQLILQYIHNTSTHSETYYSQSPKIHRIFRIDRAGEIDRMNKCGIANRHMLWHGTSAVNLLSILHRGLKVTPLEAQLSGHLFGKGIYFADMFMNSQKYSHGSNPKFMFLCEVALGRIHPVKLHHWEVKSNKPLPSNCHSLKTTDSKWEPDPASTILWKGRTMPLGRAIQNILPENQFHNLDHNEFVVFHEDQVNLRYLIQYDD